MVDLVGRKNTASRVLVLYCKDFQIIHIALPGVEECTKVAESIEKLSQIGEPV